MTGCNCSVWLGFLGPWDANPRGEVRSKLAVLLNFKEMWPWCVQPSGFVQHSQLGGTPEMGFRALGLHQKGILLSTLTPRNPRSLVDLTDWKIDVEINTRVLSLGLLRLLLPSEAGGKSVGAEQS